MPVGLLNPAGGIALGAVGILIALHLYGRRRRVIPVSALFLWRQIPPQAIERRRFRADPLFWTQLALLLALIGGYVRPWIARPAPVVDRMRLLLVLDVSASMQAREPGGSRFELARRRARGLVDQLLAGDEVMIVAAADRVHVALRWTSDRAAARGRLEALEPLDTPTDLAPAVDLALGEAESAPGCQVVVLTDLPREASGAPPVRLAAVDWIQIGATDDNVAIGGLAVDAPPFAPLADTTATVLVRNHSHTPREIVLAASAGGVAWTRRELTLAPRATEPIVLGAPPAAGPLVVTIEPDDALAVDDRAVGWIPPAPALDVALFTDSPATAAAFADAGRAFGGRVDVLPAAAPSRRDARVAVFDGVAPETAMPALYLAPPARNGVCPVGPERDDAAVADWDGEHPALAGVASLETIALPHATELVAPSWGRPIVTAATERGGFPFLVAGERDGRRIACLGAAPTRGGDDLPLLLLVLATVRWLDPAATSGALAATTGVPVALPAGGPMAEHDPSLRVAGDPPVVVAERTGFFPLGRLTVAANLFDDRESDIGRSGAREWSAAAATTIAPTSVLERRVVGRWLYAVAAVLMAVEWLLWRLVFAEPHPARLAAACRGLAAGALALVLAGVSIERSAPETGACVVAAVDVSASVAHAAIDTARAFLGRLLPRLGDEDVAGAVAFAGRTRVLARPGAVRSAAALLPADDGAGSDPDETDLAGALAAAASLCPPAKQPAIVLFTDGEETMGSAVAEAAIAEPRVPVFPVVPPPGMLASAGVRRLVAPAVAAAGAVLPLEAVLESRAPAERSAALALAVNGAALVPVPVPLAPGTTLVRLPYRFEEPGNVLVEARLLFAPGEPEAPGRVAAAMTVTGPRRVLVVSEHERPVVALALARRGMDVELTRPSGLDARAARLAGYHVVVLDDVARADVGDAALDALARRVADGGALVATGGGHLFGDAGFVGTPLERVLPVTLQSQRPEPRQREPIALYLLIDRSNSMGYASSALAYGEKMEYAKRAALAVLDQLGPRDLVGAIAFDSQPYELGPLVPLGDGRAALAAKIARLQYGGGTDFKDALETARRELVAAGNRVRHVVLLTDGDTNRRAEDHDALIAALARDEVTVTTIRIGSDTLNLDLLARISRATGGAFHHVEDVEALPQLMISDTQHLVDAAAARRDLPPHVAEPGGVLAGFDDDDFPPVSRWALTQPKPGADVRLYVDDGERRVPLLATWQYELGRVAVVPLDFQSGAAGWPTWPGFAKLWSQLATWAAPRALATDRRLVARRIGAGTLIVLDTMADGAGPFTVRVDGGDAVVLRPAGRRRFESVVPLLAPGVHPATLASGGREETTELVVPEHASDSREFRIEGPDVALLERLAALTGGRVGPEPADVLVARPGVRRRAMPLDPFLVPVALALVLADVALRRLRG
jgi:Ca-activated chloride channel family protein